MVGYITALVAGVIELLVEVGALGGVVLHAAHEASIGPVMAWVRELSEINSLRHRSLRRSRLA